MVAIPVRPQPSVARPCPVPCRCWALPCHPCRFYVSGSPLPNAHPRAAACAEHSHCQWGKITSGTGPPHTPGCAHVSGAAPCPGVPQVSGILGSLGLCGPRSLELLDPWPCLRGWEWGNSAWQQKSKTSETPGRLQGKSQCHRTGHLPHQQDITAPARPRAWATSRCLLPTPLISSNRS